MVISMNKEQCRLIQWAAFHCYNHLPDSDSDIGSGSRVIFSAGGSEAEHGSYVYLLSGIEPASGYKRQEPWKAVAISKVKK